MISGIQHVNLTVGHKDWAEEGGESPLLKADRFYAGALGLKNDPVPKGMENSLRWFSIGDSGQQIHISLEFNVAPLETRHQTRGHPCFVLPFEKLSDVIQKLTEFAQSGDAAACSTPSIQPAGIPKEEDQDNVVKGYRKGDRFFVRDFSGNRLEFSGI